MNLALSVGAELAKTKRTAALYLCLLTAAFLPAILAFNLLAYGSDALGLQKDPWNLYTERGFNILDSMFFPLFVILICTLLMQLEFRNNTWKQVFASPQPFWQVVFSKLVVVHLLILFFLLSFTLFFYGVLMATGLLSPSLQLFSHPFNWTQFWHLNLNSYLLVAGMLSFQFWLSLRIRNFIAPLGIGFCLWFASAMLAFELHWPHVDKLPHAFTMLLVSKQYQDLSPATGLWSVGYAVLFYGLALLDLWWRRSKV